jgi:LasA protease
MMCARPYRRQPRVRWLVLIAWSWLLAASSGQAATDAELASPVAISDEQFTSGPLRGEVAVQRLLEEHGSFLAAATLEPVEGIPMPAAAALTFLGEAYSVSPALLLALGEVQLGALSSAQPTRSAETMADWFRLAAMSLSRWFYDAYYGINNAPDRPLPVSVPVPVAGNAATYSLRNYYFVQAYGGGGDPLAALLAWEDKLAAVYEESFGPIRAGKTRLEPPAGAALGELPALRLPWPGGETWYLTGGPHNFDGSKRLPLSGVDFQPPGATGCTPPIASQHWVLASAPGLAIDYQRNWVKLDHDGDGDATTGWQTVYGHLAWRVADGTWARTGARLGSPSCLGGYASGVHVHFGVKFENVWQPLETVVLSGWRFERGEEAYEGLMVRDGQPERRACFRSGAPHMDCTHAGIVSDNHTRVLQTANQPY